MLFGYDTSGHYYTVALVTKNLVPRISESDASLIAFCAQLPDETEELDAVYVYRDLSVSPLSLARWLRADNATLHDSTVGRMVAVQQLLHALTGGAIRGSTKNCTGPSS